MNHRPHCWMISIWLGLAAVAGAQEKASTPAPQASPAPAAASPTPAAVEGVKGVKQEAVQKIKNVESGITTGAKNETQAVNKIDGIKADGQTVTVPVKPVAPPEVIGAKNAAEAVNKIDGVQTINGVKAEGQTVVVPVKPVVQPVINGAGSIQAVNGVTGINAAKLQNLEAALQLKHGETGPPNGKGRAAVAGLLGPPNGKPGPKTKDGRDGFQEFEKLQNSGS